MHKQQWMTDLYEELKDKTLPNLCLPGTHDSGAYDFPILEPDNYSREKQESIRKWITAATLSIGAINPIIGAGAGGTASHITTETVKAWGKTQSSPIGIQLLGGIRYLDLRVMRAKADGDLHVYHGYVGHTLTSILQDIKNFLQRPNMTELVVLSFGNLHVDESDYAKLNKLITETLGENLYPDASAKSQIANKEILANNWILDKSLEHILDGKSKAIVIFDDNQYEAYADWRFAPQRSIFGSIKWHDKSAAADLENSARNDLVNYQSRYAQYINKGLSRKLLGLQWILTPDETIIQESVSNRFHPTSPAEDLQWLSDKISHNLAHFVDSNATPINVILVDFFERTSVVELAIGLSREVAHPKITLYHDTDHLTLLTENGNLRDWNDWANRIVISNGTWVLFRDEYFSGQNLWDVYGPYSGGITPYLSYSYADGSKETKTGEVTALRPFPEYGLMLYSGVKFQGSSYHIVGMDTHDLTQSFVPGWVRNAGSLVVGSGSWNFHMDIIGQEWRGGYETLELAEHQVIDDLPAYLAQPSPHEWKWSGSIARSA